MCWSKCQGQNSICWARTASGQLSARRSKNLRLLRRCSRCLGYWSMWPLGTNFLATFSLYIFGGGEINDFAFTFLVGIITGTYSSIYIASALVLWWHKGQRPSIGGGAAQIPVESVAPARG